MTTAMPADRAFDFTPPASPIAADFLRLRANLLSKMSVAEQREWLAEWLPRIRQFPLAKGMTEFDRSLVVATLERWAS